VDLTMDLYEVTMAASYVHRSMSAPATFSLFVRALPPHRGFLVSAGVQDALDALADFEITAADADRLATLLRCDRAFVAPLAGLRFTGDVHAVPEGRIVLANEPLLEITAPLPEAQLVESVVLNAVTYQTAIASKAVRCVLAAEGRPVIDFSLRRTHGVEAANAAARATAIAGFTATSNVGAALRYGLQATGTMAHSYVQSFPDEESAFRAFAAGVPTAPTFLVDTYDLAGGLRAAARVIRDLDLPDAAVRLDSGDLDAGARLARMIMNAAGLPHVRVIVSGGLDEYRIARLRASGAPVDVFAVGSAVGVSADAPSLDSAYKLVQLGDRPVRKLSVGKATFPGAKQVWRDPAPQGFGPHDVLALRDEAPVAGHTALLEPVMRGGRRLHGREGVLPPQERLRMELADLPARVRDLAAAEPSRCHLSPGLAGLVHRLTYGTEAEPRAAVRAGSAPAP
jgi:nicotinate phosphoribosyltransferase